MPNDSKNSIAENASYDAAGCDRPKILRQDSIGHQQRGPSRLQWRVRSHFVRSFRGRHADLLGRVRRLRSWNGVPLDERSFKSEGSLDTDKAALGSCLIARCKLLGVANEIRLGPIKLSAANPDQRHNGSKQERKGHRSEDDCEKASTHRKVLIRSVQAVTDAKNRFQRKRVLAELFAKLTNVHVDRPLVAEPTNTPHTVEKLLAIKYQSLIGGKIGE